LTTSILRYLPNPFHSALSTADTPFALVHGLARRFQPDIVPFAAVSESSAGAFLDLVQLLTPGEEIYLTSESSETINSTKSMEVVSTTPSLQMRFTASSPPNEDDAGVLALAHEDNAEMLDLRARAFPGFFGPRASALGSFFGIRDLDNGRLIAMGGERLATDNEREISAVCTDSEHIGRGYASRIVRAILRHQTGLGAGSILYLSAANKRAFLVYERLGFRTTGALNLVKLRRT
jgi:GNAT superfamily N-acetyltransferase